MEQTKISTVISGTGPVSRGGRTALNSRYRHAPEIKDLAAAVIEKRSEL